ncbi:MAG: tetratricopeptide repeat protein [Thermodesulfobacteriota bacterium]
MGSPFNWLAPEPGAADPLLFRHFFGDIARQHLPCQHAELVGAEVDDVFEARLPEECRNVLALVRQNNKPVIDSHAPRLFLPLFVEGKLYGIAILEGGDPALYEKYTIKALLDKSRALTADFLALQARALDPLTSLFNPGLWRENLQHRLAKRDDFVLVLLEIYPRARDAAHGHAYLKRAAGSLDSIAGRDIPVFHLGSGVFAMLWQGATVGEVRTMADVILYRLQRDGLDRAQMGQVWVDGQGASGFNELMDRAWQAIVLARQRGPFAKAAYLDEDELGRHPFRSLAPAELNRFRNLWRHQDKFWVAALQAEQDDSKLADILPPHLGQGSQLVEREGGEVYLFLPDQDHAAALALLQHLQDKISKVHDRTFSAGLASFPCGDFKRSAVVVNARKALQHAAFFDPATITPFDGVSLNISGDVYYNEGDMNGAVREYLLGLELDPRNVNLLNSLGVAYVRLNRLKTAIGCFEKTLTVEADNYMALFNLGSAWLTRERDDLAVGFFEKALGVDDRIFDLTLQLAELYCRSGQYEKVVELLDVPDAERAKREDWEDAAAQRCLGEAWRHCDDNRRAMACLQLACGFNPQDSRALSLLGELYEVEGQGSDIALALCREAVELDDSKWDNRYRLAQVLDRQGDKQQAIINLQGSLRLKRHNRDVTVLLEKIYRETGKVRLAERMAEKLGKLTKAKQGS